MTCAISQQGYLKIGSPVEVDGAVTVMPAVVGGDTLTGAERNKPVT